MPNDLINAFCEIKSLGNLRWVYTLNASRVALAGEGDGCSGKDAAVAGSARVYAAMYR